MTVRHKFYGKRTKISAQHLPYEKCESIAEVVTYNFFANLSWNVGESNINDYIDNVDWSHRIRNYVENHHTSRITEKILLKEYKYGCGDLLDVKPSDNVIINGKEYTIESVTLNYDDNSIHYLVNHWVERYEDGYVDYMDTLASNINLISMIVKKIKSDKFLNNYKVSHDNKSFFSIIKDFFKRG